MTPPSIPSFNLNGPNKLFDLFQEHLGFLVSSQLQHNLFIVKAIFIFFSILFLIGVLYLYKKTDYLDALFRYDMRSLVDFKDLGAKSLLKQWNKIKKRLEKDSDVYCKLCLIEADKFFDDALMRMGYGGKTMDERLKRITENEVPNLSDVLRSHQVCQDIIHDPDYQLTREKTREIIVIFEKALNSLNVL